MALATFFHRDAVAISQVLSGFDESALQERVESVHPTISFGSSAARSSEGRALLDLLVRLAARLYPSVGLRAASSADSLAAELFDLARSINPQIEITDGRDSDFDVQVGLQNGAAEDRTKIYVGSDGWHALISSARPQGVGNSPNPFGAGAAACLAMSTLFRRVFLGSQDAKSSLIFPTLPKGYRIDWKESQLPTDTVLVGIGAVGNAALWALGRAEVRSRLVMVDPENVELGNLQRYVLTTTADVGRSKASVAEDFARGRVSVRAVQMDWASFASLHHLIPLALVGVDSAATRRAIQAALPRLIVNAWTQPGDLGISIHRFTGQGACLMCLYLPKDVAPNEDAIISEALRIQDQIMRVRLLLASGEGIPRDLLDIVGNRLQLDRSLLDPFEGRSLRELYTEGICGGALIPLGSLGTPRSEVHVPLAHQSALAGVLLAAQAMISTRVRNRTPITRLNVLREPNTDYLTQYAAKDPRGICICQDPDYIAAYKRKYEGPAAR